MKKSFSTRLFVGLVCAVGAGVVSFSVWKARAQATPMGEGKNFMYPDYWPSEGGVLRKKSVVTGREFRLVTNGVIALTQPRVEFFRTDGSNLQWTAVAPAATVNTDNHEVSGTNRVFFRTADDQLFHTGVGFLWQQAGSVLILSNKSFTWIDRGSLTARNSTNKMKALPILSLIATARLTAAEMEVPPTRPGLKIRGDISIVQLTNNYLTLYSNNVVVIDPPAKPGGPETRLTCDWLTMKMGTNSQPEEIAAYGRVAVDQGDLHARGNFGLYTATNDLIALVGMFDPGDTNRPRPYLYNSQGTSEGDAVIYNRVDNTLTTLKAATELQATTLHSLNPGNKPAATNTTPLPPK